MESESSLIEAVSNSWYCWNTNVGKKRNMDIEANQQNKSTIASSKESQSYCNHSI